VRIQFGRMSALALVVALCVALPSAVDAQENGAVLGSWSGTLDLPQGPQLTVVYHVERADAGGLTGTLDSPDQGATGLPLSAVTFSGGTLTLAAASISGVPTFTGTLSEDGSKLSGTFSQGGGELPLELTKQ
jgi:uncharacterized protein